MEKNLKMGSHSTMFKELDTDRENGCIRSVEYPYNKDGGSVLYSLEILPEKDALLKLQVLIRRCFHSPGMQ